MEIISYNNDIHRSDVIELWKSAFGYTDARNNPSLVIDKKLAVCDDLFFVAVADGAVTGTVMAGYDGHRGWIYSLAVDPSLWRNGIGTRLLEHAENALKELGCLKINLQVIEGNRAAVGLYQKNGYNTEARISMGKQIIENIEERD
ncbi:MAG: GNAT family acetyltransferase [Spirochaetales bacterium]|nr:GNAT family acetyltransferase [Spirochaetales bacterium]